jgi:hypothetical protein
MALGLIITSRYVLSHGTYLAASLNERRKVCTPPPSQSWAEFTIMIESTPESKWPFVPMRPKAIGLAQHCSLGGWMEASDLAGVVFVLDRRLVPPAFSIPYHLPFKNVPSCKLKKFPAAVNVQYHHHELRHATKAWPGTLVDQSWAKFIMKAL